MLALVLLAGSGTAQEEVEFPSDYETTVDSQDIGDLSYDSEARRTLLSGWATLIGRGPSRPYSDWLLIPAL